MNKICTSIGQSKKLAAGILPIESADMWWNFYSVTTDNTTPQIIHLDIPWVGSFNWNNKSDNIPCWSLAALRACLPPGISIDGILYVFESHKTFDNEWVYEYKFEDISAPLYSKSSNEIDACYELIIKLHEQNLL